MKNIKDITGYIRYFAEHHSKINHKETSAHFVELVNDGITIKIKNAVHTPFIALQKLSVDYSDSLDSFIKSRQLRLFIVDKVQDAGDFVRIQEVKSEMENVADDFLIFLHHNKRFLRICSITSATLDYIEETNMAGVILEVSIDFLSDSCTKEKIEIK